MVDQGALDRFETACVIAAFNTGKSIGSAGDIAFWVAAARTGKLMGDRMGTSRVVDNLLDIVVMQSTENELMESWLFVTELRAHISPEQYERAKAAITERKAEITEKEKA